MPTDYAERGRAAEKRHAAAKHRQRGLGKKDPVLERGKAVERAASQAKHKPRWRQRERDRTVKDDDEYEAWRENYFRQVRPDLDPQSTMSKALEFVGLDDNPYARDARSYDYRQEVFEATGDPDWNTLLNDESREDIGGALERSLGWAAPIIRSLPPPKRVFQDFAGGLNPGGYDEEPWQEGPAPPMQRPSEDERVLGQLSPEDRKTVAGMDPDEADAALKEIFPDWVEKQNPFPSSWMGQRERDGNADIGWMPAVLDQFNYSPYSTADIFSFIGPDSPETIERDISAWKGGSSSVDRTMTAAMGGDPADLGPPSQNPWVDPIEWAATGVSYGVPGMIARAAKGGRRAVGVGQRIAGKLKPKASPPSAAKVKDETVRDAINRALATTSRKREPQAPSYPSGRRKAEVFG